MTVIDEPLERVPTIPAKRHSMPRLATLAERTVDEVVVTDSHAQAAFVTALVKFKLGVRKTQPTASQYEEGEAWPFPTARALARQADVVYAAVLRRV